MPSAKKHHKAFSKKAGNMPFTSEKVKNPSFSEKIERANELLSATVFLKKKKNVAIH